MYENGDAFSSLKQTCLEIATLDIQLNSLTDGSKTNKPKAFVLFNDDKTKAEIFLPDNNKGITLEKSNNGNWSNSEYTLIAWKGLVLQKNGKAVYGG